MGILATFAFAISYMLIGFPSLFSILSFRKQRGGKTNLIQFIFCWIFWPFCLVYYLSGD